MKYAKRLIKEPVTILETSYGLIHKDGKLMTDNGPLTWWEPAYKGKPRVWKTFGLARRALTMWCKGPIMIDGPHKTHVPGFSRLYEGGKAMHHDLSKALHPRIKEDWKVIEIQTVIIGEGNLDLQPAVQLDWRRK